MIYILNTKTRAMFDNMPDAERYFARLRLDEPYARIGKPRRDANKGLYVVTMSKREDVQSDLSLAGE